jgi:hypothetical protein
MFKELRRKLFIRLKQEFEPAHEHVYVQNYDKLDRPHFVAYIDRCDCGAIQTRVEEVLQDCSPVSVHGESDVIVDTTNRAPKKGEPLIRTVGGELLYERRSDLAETDRESRAGKKASGSRRRSRRASRRRPVRG